MFKKIRKGVFLVPAVLILISILASIFFESSFEVAVTNINSLLLSNLSWFISIVGVLMIGFCVYAWFSPLGNVRIGGKDATPILKKWNWRMVTLCSTVAVGILFWSAAEPILHYAYPPSVLNIKPESYESAIFSMSTMFMHWSFTGFAIYCVPALVFALVYHNKKQKLSLGSMISPLFDYKEKPRLESFIDIISLFSLALGISASLGAGVLMLAKGLQITIPNISNPSTLFLPLIVVIMVLSTISSISGVTKGIKILSQINIIFFIVLLSVAFLFGPMAFILNLSTESFGVFIDNFFTRSLFIESIGTEQWPQGWTTFYWSTYFAWAPISAIFLGKIARGYTVKEFIKTNLIVPAMFSIVYVAIIGGSVIFQQINGLDLITIFNEQGYEFMIYALLDTLPAPGILTPIFIFVVFLSFVTAADSNTNVMASLSTKNSNLIDGEAPNGMKIIWCGLIGTLAYIMLSMSGIDGVKMLANIGGFPSAILIFIVSFSLIKLVKEAKENKL